MPARADRIERIGRMSAQDRMNPSRSAAVTLAIENATTAVVSRLRSDSKVGLGCRDLLIRPDAISRIERAFKDVRDGVLLVEVKPAGAGEITRDVQGKHPVAGGRIRVVRAAQTAQDGLGVGRVVALHGVREDW